MRGAAALLAFVLLAGISGCARAEREPNAPPSSPETRAERGKEWFRSYCVSCHGVSARGDGPVAKALKPPPADLTRIAYRNGGVFDAPKVAGFVDGRTRVGAHGSSEMPVWGRKLDDRSSAAAQEETRLDPGTIYLIVEYLRSIQAGD
jgi:mono/diheme cytochrome c family protein